MHGSMVSGIQLQVSLARRQPQIEPINDATSSTTWSTLGKNNHLFGTLDPFEAEMWLGLKRCLCLFNLFCVLGSISISWSALCKMI